MHVACQRNQPSRKQWHCVNMHPLTPSSSGTCIQRVSWRLSPRLTPWEAAVSTRRVCARARRQGKGASSSSKSKGSAQYKGRPPRGSSEGTTGSQTSKVDALLDVALETPSDDETDLETWGPDLESDPYSSSHISSKEAHAFERIMNPVVKVYCRHTEPNFSLPWQRQRQFSSTSSGFAVAWGEKPHRWLLTNAHSVEYHSQVKVKRRGDDRKYIAKVLSIGTECDIALLTVEDDAFWDGVKPIRLGPMPMLQESVAVVGYPVGGDTTSVTAGVVSRIEVTSYVHGSTQLLGVQIDAAINSGNSGGPVFNAAGELVGIAFQSFAGGDAENIGWVIPTAVVHHFLEDFHRHGKFTGFPTVGLQWQRMESDALRKHCHMKRGDKGVLITHVLPTSSAASVLCKGDVLTKFDGHEIACDGTVAFRTGERMAFSYLVSKRFVGDDVTLTILRNGKLQDVPVSLSPPMYLVPPHLAALDPHYYVASGLVLTVATEPFLSSEYGADFMSSAPVKLLEKVFHGRMKSPEEQVVVLSQVLACEATIGYEDATNIQVLRFNGVDVVNIFQLAQLIQTCTDEFYVFDLDYDEILVLDAQQARASTEEILRVHNIPRQMSVSVETYLNSKSDAETRSSDGSMPDANEAPAKLGQLV